MLLRRLWDAAVGSQAEGVEELAVGCSLRLEADAVPLRQQQQQGGRRDEVHTGAWGREDNCGGEESARMARACVPASRRAPLLARRTLLTDCSAYL